MTRIVAILDYETTGTDLSCSLVAAGLAIADLDNPEFILLHTYYDKILFDKKYNPLKFDDVSTLLWWFKQSPEAQQAFEQTNAKPLAEVLTNINHYVSQPEISEFLSKGADFDIAMTIFHMAELGIKPGWNYRILGCFRTYERIYKFPKLHAAHNALADATEQLRVLHSYYHTEAPING